MKIFLTTLALLLTSTVHADDEFYVHGIVKLAFPDGRTSVNYEVSGPMNAKLCEITISEYERVMQARVDGSQIAVMHVSATCNKQDWFGAKVLNRPERA